jgi:hypothetical protein
MENSQQRHGAKDDDGRPQGNADCFECKTWKNNVVRRHVRPPNNCRLRGELSVLQNQWQFRLRDNARTNAPARVLITPVPYATLLKGFLCLPTAPALPTRDNGDFGTSPIYEQLSNKPPLVLFLFIYMGCRIKSTIEIEK